MVPAFSQKGKRKPKTHVIRIKSCSVGFALLIFKFVIEMELNKCLAKELMERKEKKRGEEEGGDVITFLSQKGPDS